jgi:DNA-binding MarR family transcriptional regulator
MPTPSAFLPLLRELARTYQAFESYSAIHIRSLDLTPPQFDIIATLGNTPGMSCKELGEKTLITKGTLTGVIDRLMAKQLVTRVVSESDGRSQIVQLTGKGQALFEQVFPLHMAFMERAFQEWSLEDMATMAAALSRLRLSLAAARQQLLETSA